MIKKLISIFTILLLSLSVASLATFANDNETVEIQQRLDRVPVTYELTSNNTEDNSKLTNSTLENDDNLNETEDKSNDDKANETVILADKTGAQVRLLQLQKRVEVQIVNANDIISRLVEENNSADKDRLNEIVIEFNAITLSIEEFNMEGTVDELAGEYIALKAQAIELSKEFRNLVKGQFSEAKKAEIRARYQAKVEAKKAEKNAKIEELKNKYNAKRVEVFMKNLGKNNPELVASVESGNMTIKEIKTKLKEEYNKLDFKKKAEAIKRVKKARDDIKERSEAQREELKVRSEQAREELKTRIEDRREELKQRTDKLKERLNDRKAEIELEIEDNE